MSAEPEPAATTAGGRVMDAALELLDRQLLDRDGRAAGKVDDLELTLTDDGHLMVSAILSGPGALAPRLDGRLGAAWAGVFRRLHPEEDPTAARVPMNAVHRMDDDIELVTAAADLESHRFERWVCDHIISRIPGSDHDPD